MPVPALALAAAPSVISGIAGFLGGERANKVNQREAERNRSFQAGEAATNRSFQERMRNTEWQAGIADMQAAGLNPALAYSHGGASAPSGSMAGGTATAPAHDSVSSAMQGMRMRQEMQLMAEQIKKTGFESKMAQALSDREEVRNIAYGFKRTGAGLEIDFDMPGLIEETKALISQRIAEAQRAGSMAQIAGLGGQVADGFGSVMPAFQSIMGVAGQGADALAGTIGLLERAARMRDDAVQQYFGLPKRAVLKLLETLRSRK